MGQKYNSSPDTLAHKARVKNLIKRVTNDLNIRSRNHDNSKLLSPEKELFDLYITKLNQLEYGSEEYNLCHKDMIASGMGHHYANNDHHPEHFENGIKDMNLIQLLEMLSDWMAVCEIKGEDIIDSINYGQTRFGYSDEIKNILINTAKYINELKR